MAEYITIKEASEKWKVSERRINALCKEGRIPGAYKDEKRWQIPEDATKPVDNRKTYTMEKHLSDIVSVRDSDKKLPLPIGISDYRKAVSDYYYIDKTLFIKDFIDERPYVSLFTRPRRFGKTLNMDMLRTFFEISDEDTSIYFKNKKIWACGKEYQEYQGKYPVIYVTFKDVKCQDWGTAYEYIYKILRNEFERHDELLNSNWISSYERKYIKCMLDGEASKTDVACSFLNLSRMLYKHYDTAPIIIIDEYDTPIQQGYVRGYYDEVIDFMRALFSGGLKDNPYLSYGFLTGILRVAKESIFSGLNNIKINSVLENKYSEYFGFTEKEVREMAEYYGFPEKFDEICEWYDGYRFGKTEIFNPWSVIGYFDNECIPRAFWQSTGSNDIIGEVLANASIETYERLEMLMRGESFVTNIDTSVIYPQIQKNPSSIYSFLLVAGYLKTVSIKQVFSGDYMCEVALPNKEISCVYSKEILSRFEEIVPTSVAIAVQEAIYTMDVTKLQNKLESFLIQTISYHDASNETFYHGLILGLCAMLDNQYQLTSNREAGAGRFDIQLLPINRKLPGILIEIKAEKGCTEEQLEALALKAYKQIEEKKYYADMQSRGVREALQYGIAFSGKNVKIIGKKNMLDSSMNN